MLHQNKTLRVAVPPQLPNNGDSVRLDQKVFICTHILSGFSKCVGFAKQIDPKKPPVLEKEVYCSPAIFTLISERQLPLTEMPVVVMKQEMKQHDDILICAFLLNNFYTPQ